MEQSLKIGKTQWIYVTQPNKEIINKLAQEYDFHEVIVNDLIEINAQSKIDSNSKHFFLALTFTKYVDEEQRYLFNELDVIIGNNYIITTTSLESQALNDLFETFRNGAEQIDGSYTLDRQKNQGNEVFLDARGIPTTGEAVSTSKAMGSQCSKAVVYKSSPYYILSRIIDVFYEKTIKSLAISSKRLLDIQENIASRKAEKEVVEELMNEDLNKIFIKHNFLSQEDVIQDLDDHVNGLHEKHLNVYFNSLKVKLSRIINTINVLSEKNDSLMSAYNTFVGIKNNNSVTRLTFVMTIFMPLTLIAGIGGMSERSMMTGPENWKIAYPAFFLLCAALGYITFLVLRKYFMKK